MKKYFEADGISNSLLSRVGYFFQQGILDRFNYESIDETLSMFIGSQVHKAIETNGSSIEHLKIIDDSCFVEKDESGSSLLTSNEIKILKSDNPEEEYFNQYKNKLVTIAKEAWDKPELDDKQLKAVQNVKEHIKSILSKGASYIDSKASIADSDILLNEYLVYERGKLITISNPKEVLDTIRKSYEAVCQSRKHEDLIHRDLFENVVEHFEFEYYSDLDGYAVKGMFDRIILYPEQKRAILIDYKTYSRGSIEKSILNYDYIRQLSWYLKLFEMWLRDNGYTGYSVETYIVGISTTYYKVDIVPLSIKSLQAGMYGGYLKPSMYTMYNDQEEFDPYLNDADVEWLRHNNIWSSTSNNQFKRLGWRKIFDIGVEYELFEQFKI